MNAKNLLLSLLFLSGIAGAQTQQHEVSSGPYTVYYSLFPSTFIRADIAERYGLTRGTNRVILNVSVREALSDGSDREKSASIRGQSSDLVHKTPLQFNEIREQGAIYYLAQITVTGTPTLYFDLQVQPDPDSSPIPITFKQQVFTD